MARKLSQGSSTPVEHVEMENSLPYLKHRIFFFFGVIGLLALAEFGMMAAETFFTHLAWFEEVHFMIESAFLLSLAVILYLVVRLYRILGQTHQTACLFIEHMVQGGRDQKFLQKIEITTEEQHVLMNALTQLFNYVVETEGKLKESVDEAQRALKIKQEFLAVMSHEIRTPLNGMLGMAGLLKDTSLTSDQANYLNVIRDSGEHLLLVINDILDFSKLEAGKMNLEMVNFDVHRLVESVCELLSPAGHAKGVEVGTYLSSDIPQCVRGDVARIRQVLNNLVSNAIKFTQEGAVMVEVLLESRGDETVMLKFKVADTGIGIARDKMPQLFKRFSQVDEGVSRKFGGTGLGLSICKQLVEMMGGEVCAESRFGSGSVFTFTVPVAIEEATETGRDQILAGKRAMVVDDHDFNRHIFKRQLEGWGMTVETAGDGPEALVKLEEAASKEKTYDVAIIDHQMPNMSGEEVLEYILSNEKHKNMQAILASSQNISGADPYFRDLGFAAILTKPVREASLQKWLLRVLKQEIIADEQPVGVLQKQDWRVLLVEDNYVNQLFMQGILAPYCKVVDTAANGVEAVALAHKLPYDVILMDINMPMMDGLQATIEIRHMHPPYSETPVIGITADISAERLLACYEAGMNEVLHKPVSAERVIQGINTVVTGEEERLKETKKVRV